MNPQLPTELTPATARRTIDPAARRNIIIGVLLAMFLAALDQTIVAPALPTIGSFVRKRGIPFLDCHRLSFDGRSSDAAVRETR
jgi:hypothetical protein